MYKGGTGDEIPLVVFTFIYLLFTSVYCIIINTYRILLTRCYGGHLFSTYSVLGTNKILRNEKVSGRGTNRSLKSHDNHEREVRFGREGPTQNLRLVEKEDEE